MMSQNMENLSMFQHVATLGDKKSVYTIDDWFEYDQNLIYAALIP